MPDFSKLETSIPVAPLNLIVMDSAKELGDSVDHYIAEFRHNLYKMPENDPAFHGYVKELKKELLSMKASAETTSIFLPMSAITALLIKCITT